MNFKVGLEIKSTNIMQQLRLANNSMIIKLLELVLICLLSQGVCSMTECSAYLNTWFVHG